MRRILLGIAVLLVAALFWFSLGGRKKEEPPMQAVPALASAPLESAPQPTPRTHTQTELATSANISAPAAASEPVPQKPPSPPTKNTLPLLGADGHLLLMGQAQAMKECAKRGMHLPTAREIIEVMQSWGGKGIVDGSQEKSSRIIARNPGGKIDDFFYYFDWDGFVLPPGELGKLDKHEIITASVDAHPERPSDSPCALKLGMVHGKDGGLTLRCSGYYDLPTMRAMPDLAEDARSAVLCLENGPTLNR